MKTLQESHDNHKSKSAEFETRSINLEAETARMKKTLRLDSDKHTEEIQALRLQYDDVQKQFNSTMQLLKQTEHARDHQSKRISELEEEEKNSAIKLSAMAQDLKSLNSEWEQLFAEKTRVAEEVQYSNYEPNHY